MSIHVLTSHVSLLLTMSQNGETVISSGGKASENGVTSADVKGNSYNVWEDDWSN